MNPAILKTIVNGLLVSISLWMFTGCFHSHTPPGPKASSIDPGIEAPSIDPGIEAPLIDPAIETLLINPGIEAPLIDPAIETLLIDPGLETPHPSAVKDEFYIHPVRWSGETVSIISQWYTGSPDNWKSVASANYDLNPDRILIGDYIIIPVHLLKTTKPMPRKHLSSYLKRKSPPSSSLNPVIEASEIELFGPKEIEPQVAELQAIELFGPRDIEQFKTEVDEIELFER